MKSIRPSLALLAFPLIACGGTTEPTPCAEATAEEASALDCEGTPEEEEEEEVELVTVAVTESYESDIGGRWISAGQPTDVRVEDVVGQGATVISLRLSSEDPFDEPALIESLGGTFIRYPTTPADYNNVAFREALYDLYDEHRAGEPPVYLHCASGNRAGASWALYQAERLGTDSEEAVTLGKAAGLGSLETTVRTILGL
jgi:protein tyrosine phosphatase (PTP) superfamily phosphohydrolase (DUF442 family)